MLEIWIIHDGPPLYTIKDVLTTGHMNLKGKKAILVDVVFAHYMTLSPPINHLSPTNTDIFMTSFLLSFLPLLRTETPVWAFAWQNQIGK